MIHNTRNSSKKPIDKRHVTVKQPIGLRDWHSAINKALYPFKGRDQEADNKITRQISRFQSLDPEERNATDVEQIYQVRWLEGRWTVGKRFGYTWLRYSEKMFLDLVNLELFMVPDIEQNKEKLQ